MSRSEQHWQAILDQIVAAFELAWQSGSRPDLEAFLSDSQVPRLEALRELVRLDLHHRLHAGEPARVEDYLSRFPELAEDSQHVVELIAAEHRQRCRGHESPPLQEYLERFPRWRAELLQSPVASEEITTVHADTVRRFEELPARLSRYRIEDEVGRGGMGRVVRVHDEQFDRPMALKVFAPSGGEKLNPALKAHLEQRFEREAQLTGQMQHPGIPPVQEKGRLDDGRPYFIMKLVQGQSLLQLLRERSAPTEDLPHFLNIFRGVCDTLAYVHARGILHRDLKPANVMVGAFGEVQVMDWGLARAPGVGDVAEDSDPRGDHPGGMGLAHSTPTPGEGTIPGSILGTPAYMAPEQARGEIANLDARCDVFGLGGILCAILTGKPPFTAGGHVENRTLAREGNLADAFVRLDACGADPELIRLARRCLAPQKEDRPAHAGEVSAAIVHHQAAVAERLRQAEVQRAQAEVKAAEEQKRLVVERQKRRLGLWLAVAVVVLVLGGSGTALWYQHEQAARDIEETQRAAEEERRQGEEEFKRARAEQGIADALTQAKKVRDQLQMDLAKPGGVFVLLNRPESWEDRIKEAKSAVASARGLHVVWRDRLGARLGYQIQALAAQLEQDDRDLKVALRLERVRLDRSTLVEGKLNVAWANEEYPRVFQEDLQLSLAPGQEKEVIAAIQRSPIKEQLVGALDDWALVGLSVKHPEHPDVSRRLKLVQQAAPSPLGDSIRDPEVWKSATRVKALTTGFLTDTTQMRQMSPQMLLVLGYLLRAQKEDAEPWFREALVLYPADFWLNWGLGYMTDGSIPGKANPVKAEGCYRVAVAIRPTIPTPYFNLGVALSYQKDYPAAIAAFRKAIDLDPTFGRAHYSLGTTFAQQKDWPAASAAFRKAIECEPGDYKGHNNSGLVLLNLRDFKAAVAAFEKAADLAPKDPEAWNNLGLARLDLKDPPGAVLAFKEALQRDRNHKQVHHNLGLAYAALKDWPAAVVAFREAEARDPDARTYDHLGQALIEVKDFPGALATFQKWINLEPKKAGGHYGRGVVFQSQNELPAAVAAFKKAIELDDSHQHAHYNLGQVLFDLRDLSGAIAAYRKATDLDPKDARAHHNLGRALQEQKDFPAAIVAFNEAIRLAPSDAIARRNLGTVYADQQNWPAAISAYRDSIKLDAKDAKAHDNLGLALLEIKDVTGAIAAFRKAIECDERLGPPRYNLGNALRQQGDLPGAVAAYRKGVELVPNNPTAHVNLGVGLGEQGDYPGAIACFRKAIDLAPRLALAHFNLGLALRLHKDVPGAIAAYRKALECDGTNADYHNGLGLVLQDQKNHVAAIAAFRKAINLDPRHAIAWTNLGVLLTLEKDLPGAIHAYRQAMEHDRKASQPSVGLGVALLEKGDFSEAAQALVQALKLVPAQHPLRARVEGQLKTAEQMVGLEKRLPQVLKSGSASLGEIVALARLCQRYRQRYQDAAYLYEMAFSVEPAITRNQKNALCFNAACAAVLAAEGKGKTEKPLTDRDRGRLRKQALDWLRGDVGLWRKAMENEYPLGVVFAEKMLAHWQQEASLASVRADKELAQLGEVEQQSWKKLWAEVRELSEQARSSFKETTFKAELTPKERERAHEVKFAAGKAYVIDMESKQFDTYLRLEDDKGKVVEENDDIDPKGRDLNSRIVFTPKQDGSYRLVATSYQQRGTGVYTLTVREVLPRKK